jgi:hypothetical protein
MSDLPSNSSDTFNGGFLDAIHMLDAAIEEAFHRRRRDLRRPVNRNIDFTTAVIDAYEAFDANFESAHRRALGDAKFESVQRAAIEKARAEVRERLVDVLEKHVRPVRR